jgi:hypothetical protein
MSLDQIPQAFRLTIIQQIAMMLLAASNGNLNDAREAAAATLAGFDPKNEAELRLVARIVGFSLQAGEALAQAAEYGMPITRVIRLRTGAVALSREAQKAEQQLTKLRQAAAESEAQPEVEPVPPNVEKTAELVEDTRKISSYAKAHGLTFTQALQQRERDRRLAARAAKEAARAAAGPAAASA